MNAQEIISAQLESGETLIWAEAADANAIVSDFAPALAWGILFTVFSAIILVAILRQRGADMSPEERRTAWGGIAIAGVFVLVGATILYVAGTEVLSASSTSYGLTDRRVVVVRESPLATVDSYPPAVFMRMAAWEDEARLDFQYSGPQKGSDYDARLHVRDPQVWEERIRATFGLEREADIPD